MRETALTRFHEEYGSVSSLDWTSRLLSPERLASICPTTLGPAAVAEPPDAWWTLALPAPVLHPAISKNRQRPIETLLEIPAAHVTAVLYERRDAGPDLLVVEPGDSSTQRGELVDQATFDAQRDGGMVAGFGAAALEPLLARLDLPPKDAPVSNAPREGLLQAFAAHDARPEWMVLHRVPVPPRTLCAKDTQRHLARLLTVARMLATKPDGDRAMHRDLQAAYDAFYFAFVDDLGLIEFDTSPEPTPLDASHEATLKWHFEDGHVVIARVDGGDMFVNRSSDKFKQPTIRQALAHLQSFGWLDDDDYGPCMRLDGDVRATPIPMVWCYIGPVSEQDGLRLVAAMEERTKNFKTAREVAEDELAKLQPGDFVRTSADLGDGSPNFGPLRVDNVPPGLATRVGDRLFVEGFVHAADTPGGPLVLWSTCARPQKFWYN